MSCLITLHWCDEDTKGKDRRGLLAKCSVVLPQSLHRYSAACECSHLGQEVCYLKDYPEEIIKKYIYKKQMEKLISIIY